MQSLNATVEAQRRERDWALGRGSVPRELAVPLSKALASPLVKVITGPRRAGKSTLAVQVLAGRRFAYVKFEDDALRAETSGDDLVEAIEAVYGETEFLFFDEIQNYPRWESFINKLHRRGRNLVITGSNSRLLSRELASALTGRHLPFELLPFSFLEFLLATATRQADAAESFQRYLLWGGFPEVVLASAEPSGYLRTLFDSVVLRDIVTRHRIRASTAMHDLLSLLINNAASRFSARSLERSLARSPRRRSKSSSPIAARPIWCRICSRTSSNRKSTSRPTARSTPWTMDSYPQSRSRSLRAPRACSRTWCSSNCCGADSSPT